MTEKSKTCPFDKLRAGSQPVPKDLKSEDSAERAGAGG